MSSISSKISLFDSKGPTTTNHSPTKSVSFGSSKQTQQQQNFALNNDSWLKNSYLQQQKPSSNHQNSASIDKSNKFPSSSGELKKQIEDNCVSHRNKMVAKQEIVNETQVQPTTECEEEGEDSFKYGPGFVSKLRYRYLSLTLRQTSVAKQRPSLAQLRRSTSLNNLLDEETDEHEQDTVHGEEEEEHTDTKANEVNAINGNSNNKVALENQKNHIRNGIEKPLTESFPPPSDGHHIRTGRSVDKSLNLKRARSVEAILRYDHTAWERDVQKDHIEHVSVKKACDVTIEDKIHNARERTTIPPPKRLTSLIDDDERPPPGICKQTMRIFEASANRKRNTATRPIGQEVANKVAMFKCQEKPAVASKKPNIHPRITSPKPINQLNNNSSNNVTSKTMNNGEKFAKYSKEKTVLPKLDINIIKNNLETKSNGSWSPADNKDSYRNMKQDYSPAHSDSSLSSTPNVLSPFRNSMSPQLNDPVPVKKLDPTASPLITSLSSKLNNLHMETSTPKAYSKSNNLLKIADDADSVVCVDKDASDNKHTSNGDVKSPIEEAPSAKTVMSFIPKINNNVGTNGKMSHEKSPDNNGEVKMVKDNFAITKPTQAPPPPPYTMKPTQPAPPSRDIDDKSSFAPPTNDSKNSSEVVVDSSSASSAAPKWTVKKKSWSSQSDDSSANTIVFNFSDRKDVPDYIEHDGLILRRKRELPKANESGFVLLGDLTLDSSTDPDDGSYQMGPPSPCDVEFENANIVPDGKSSIRSRAKEVKFKIQFDDSLTATFEYPSETSLMIDEWLGDEDEVDASFYGRTSNNNSASSPSSSSKLLTSVPLGSTPFANYQPQKASGTTFELGITRTTPSPSSASSDENTFISHTESDGDDYLKPATDEESQRWSSEGTRGTDLLF